MARRYFGRTLAQEQEELEAVEKAADVEEKAADAEIAGAETLETELLEVAEQVEEQEERDEAIEEGEVVVDELEEEVENMEVAQESGGLDAVAAGILMRSVNSKLDRLGMDHVRVGAMESFGSLSSRQAATQVAMEAIGEKIKKIWDAIIAAIVKSAEWLKKFVLNLFGTYERLEKRAVAIAERAAKVEGTAKESSIDKEALANKLLTSDGRGTVLSGVNNIKYLTSKVISSAQALEPKLSNAVSKLKSIGSKDDFEDAAKELVELDNTISSKDIFSEILKGGKSTTEGEGEDAYEKLSSVSLPGGKVVNATTGSKLYSHSIRLSDDNTAAKRNNSKLDVLSKDDAKAIAEAVVSIAKEAAAARKVMDNFTKAKEKFASEVKSFSKVDERVQKSKDEGTAAEISKLLTSTIRKSTTAVSRLMGDFPAQWLAYTVTTSKAALDYCELSLKQYK